MDFEILLLGFLILITIIIVALMMDNYLRGLKEREIYEMSLKNLENQLQNGNISEKTYKELRINLDERYFDRIRKK
jgi:hypothetical protein